MIYPFEERESWEEQWPDFEPITQENAALRFRQYQEFTDYIKEIAASYMKGNDIQRYDRGTNDGYNHKPWNIKFKLCDTYISFSCHWECYFRGEYDDGDTWAFSLNYDVFTFNQAEILNLGAKEKEEQLAKEKRIEEERKKKQDEEQKKRDLEYRKKQYETLKKEFEK